MKIQKGDKVRVMKGKDRGKEGIVERVYEKQGKIIVQGINLAKRHVRKNEQLPEGGIVDIPRPLQVSNVMILCSKCKKPVRVQYKLEKDQKIRVCAQCDAQISSHKK